MKDEHMPQLIKNSFLALHRRGISKEYNPFWLRDYVSMHIYTHNYWCKNIIIITLQKDGLIILKNLN